MAPLVWPNGLAVQNRRRSCSARGSVRSGTDAIRERTGRAAVDVRSSGLLRRACGRRAGGRLYLAADFESVAARRCATRSAFFPRRCRCRPRPIELSVRSWNCFDPSPRPSTGTNCRAKYSKKTLTLFARLLCEHSPIPARRSVIKESSHE